MSSRIPDLKTIYHQTMNFSLVYATFLLDLLPTEPHRMPFSVITASQGFMALVLRMAVHVHFVTNCIGMVHSRSSAISISVSCQLSFWMLQTYLETIQTITKCWKWLYTCWPLICNNWPVSIIHIYSRTPKALAPGMLYFCLYFCQL